MTDKADTPGTPRKWNKADKINGAGVLLALLGLISGVVLPDALHGIAYLRRPRASITWPNNYAKLKDNIFNSYGTASNIPGSSDLWLIVRSSVEGRWYPVERLSVANGSWHVPKRVICPAPGLQELLIYDIPDSEEGQLFAYQRSEQEIKGVGINSMPPDSAVQAAANVQVPSHTRPWC